MLTSATAAQSAYPQQLLVLELNGCRYFFAERGPFTMSVDGEDVKFDDGLTLESARDVVQLYGDTADTQSIPVQVRLPLSMSPADLSAIGVNLAACRCWVYHWSEGAFETAKLLAVGLVTDPVYGDPSDPQLLGFSIERDLTERGALLPRGNVVQDGSWDSVAVGDSYDGTVGLSRSVVYGRPGYASWGVGITDATTARAQLALVERTGSAAFVAQLRVSVAGHKVDDTVAPVKVYSKNGTAEVLNLINDVDDYRQPVSYIDFSTAATFTGATLTTLLSEPDSIGISWIKEAQSGLLGDVAESILRRSSLARVVGGVDWALVGANKERLNALGRIDVAIDDAALIKPLDYLRDEILPWFPAFLGLSGNGYYVGAWQYEARADDTVFSIDTSIAGYEAIAPISMTSTDIANDVTIRAAYSAATGGVFGYQVRLSGDPTAVEEDADVRSSKALLQSFKSYGRREVVLDCPILWDTSTIERAADYYVHRYALPKRSTGYAVPWRTHDPQQGDPVLIVDAARGLNGVKALIDGVQYVNGRLEVRVVLL